MKDLIPLAYLKEECFLSNHVDDRKYMSSLKWAQKELREVLGPEFYADIETQYDPNTNTFTADNLILYEDYIKEFLAWQTYLEYLGFSQNDSTATGFREHSDENSTLVDNIKLFGLEKNVLKRAQDTRTSIINFLKLSQEQDATKYPKWIGCTLDQFSFGISSVSGQNLGVYSVNKAIIRQE